MVTTALPGLPQGHNGVRPPSRGVLLALIHGRGEDMYTQQNTRSYKGFYFPN